MIKKINIFCGIAIIVFIFGFLTWNPEYTRANPSSVQVYTNGTTVNSVSTTTAPYRSVAMGTTTIAFDPQNGNTIQLSFSAHSTSTPTIVYAGLDLSNDGIDFYEFETKTSPGALTSGVVGDLWSWTAATTSVDQTVSKTFTITPLNYAAKYSRLRYNIAGGAAEVLVQVAQKKEF